jgi:hypothetical protein
MISEITATVDNGILRPDVAIPFPDQTRVKLTIEAVEPQNQPLEAWNRFEQLVREKPIPGLAQNFSREGVYVRD